MFFFIEKKVNSFQILTLFLFLLLISVSSVVFAVSIPVFDSKIPSLSQTGYFTLSWSVSEKKSPSFYIIEKSVDQTFDNSSHI